MNKRPWKYGAALVALVAVVWIVQAGNLEPPGPPAPSMKPLDVVEARVPLSNTSFLVPAPGSYYLTEDLTAASGTGLSIASDDVTIDLNGFAIVGAGTGGIHGVNIGDASNVTVRNGTIRGFDRGIGVNTSTNVRLLALNVLGNTSEGIDSFDSNLTVDGCHIEGNGATGIAVSADFFNLTESLIQNNAIAGNGGAGIVADATLLVIQDNLVQLNDGRGIEISMTNAKVIDNTVDLNGGSGIRSGITSGTISGNLCFSNGQSGSGFGIEVVLAEAGQFVARNQAAGNASGEYSIDSGASAAPVSSLAAGAGAWDNLIPNP